MWTWNNLCFNKSNRKQKNFSLYLTIHALPTRSSGEQILATIDSPNLGRLDRPDLCPRVYNDLMQRCWRHEAKERPSFEEVASQIGLLRPDICRCTTDTVSIAGCEDSLTLRQGDTVVVLDKKWAAGVCSGKIPRLKTLTSKYRVAHKKEKEDD